MRVPCPPLSVRTLVSPARHYRLRPRIGYQANPRNELARFIAACSERIRSYSPRDLVTAEEQQRPRERDEDQVDQRVKVDQADQRSNREIKSLHLRLPFFS